MTAESSVEKITATVNQKEAPPIEGLFVSVGQLKVGEDKKAMVTITNEGTDGHVLVDAVQLLPVK